jgi:hypothetical protein
MSILSPTSLPAEIIDAILVNLVGYELLATSPPPRPDKQAKKDLRACGLISKTWLQRSRRYLFCCLFLNNLASKYPKRHSFPPLECIDSPLTNVAPYVRHLQIGGRYPLGGWLNQVLPQSKALLSTIEYLSVKSGEFQTLSDATIINFISSFNMLKYLQFRHCTFSSPHQLSVVLSTAPNLEHLELQYVQVSLEPPNRLSRLSRLATQLAHPIHSSPLSRPLSDRLHVLDIAGYPMEDVSGWLRSGDNIPAVDTVRLTLDGQTNMSKYSELMRMVGSSLKDLTIIFINRQAAEGMLTFHSHRIWFV